MPCAMLMLAPMQVLAVLRAVRRQSAHGVAADVAAHEHPQLLEHHEDAPVRAARAERGRPVGQVGSLGAELAQQVRVHSRDAGLGERLRHRAGVELAQQGVQLLAAVDLDAHQPDGFFHEGVGLLDHVELLHLGAEVGDELLGQRDRSCPA